MLPFEAGEHIIRLVMKHNTITLGQFVDAQKVASHLIMNRGSFNFTASRAEAPGYQLICIWDQDLASAVAFCNTHNIAYTTTYLEL